MVHSPSMESMLKPRSYTQYAQAWGPPELGEYEQLKVVKRKQFSMA